MNISQRGGPPQRRPAKSALKREWIRRLGPPAHEAKKWIRRQWKKWGADSKPRELWIDYAREKVDPVTLRNIPGLLTGFGADLGEVYETNPERHFKQISYAKIAGKISAYGLKSGKAILEGMTPKELKDKRRTILRFLAETCLSFGLIPRMLFFDLARQESNLAPSIAVRRFARKLEASAKLRNAEISGRLKNR